MERKYPIDSRSFAWGQSLKVAGTFLLLLAALAAPSNASSIRMVEQVPDPHGIPRPARNSENVPLRTSLYFELALPEAGQDRLLAESITVHLQAGDTKPVELLGRDRQFADGVSGWLRPRTIGSASEVAVYLEPAEALEPATPYTVHITARSREGAEFVFGDPLYRPGSLSFGALGGKRQPAGPEQWRFTTEDSPRSHSLPMKLDFEDASVRWHGAFFSGVCNVVFCTNDEVFGSTHELMDQARKRHPNAWSFQRDFWLTGTEHTPTTIFSGSLPNLVREKETRRVVAIQQTGPGILLRLEDIFGHEQYGVPAGRLLSGDYRPGYEVLVADGVNDARATVLAVDDEARTVLLDDLPAPEDGWGIDYRGSLPQAHNPDWPGLFPPGGCYLRRFNPSGTAVYFWDRLHKEWDMTVKRYGRRVMPNFADAAGCLSLTGRAGYTAKDLVQWHEVVRTITDHLIDRYGDAALGFTWSVFNEPDLSRSWLDDWDELLRFYDYTVDAILRAFEDRGYDSTQVFVGGLELGAIFGANLRLREFLLHCSPNAEAPGEVKGNAAFADPRLEGKRSRRVEELCRANHGRGSPLDFISIHLYNRSRLAAEKLFRAKQMALEIDEAFFEFLWINSHEACPDWKPPPDPAAAEAYLGNGYFKSWTLDLVTRQLRQGARDPRFARGETLLTVWPPVMNFSGLNAITRRISIADTPSDGPRTITVPNPIFHTLGLLSDFADRYWVLPELEAGDHVVSGFASRDENGAVRAVLYSHAPADTQSRSDASFQIALAFENHTFQGKVRVREYRFNRQRDSFFQAVRRLRDDAAEEAKAHRGRLEEILKAVEGDTPHRALQELQEFVAATNRDLAAQIAEFAKSAGEEEIRQAARALRDSEYFFAAFPSEDLEQVREASRLRVTRAFSHSVNRAKPLSLEIPVAGNGLVFLVIETETDE